MPQLPQRPIDIGDRLLTREPRPAGYQRIPRRIPLDGRRRTGCVVTAAGIGTGQPLTGSECSTDQTCHRAIADPTLE
jgi:hypothetical protein